MAFLSYLDTRAYLPREFVLTRRLGFEFERNGRPTQVWVPRAFITDFASVPKPVQMMPGFDVNGASRPAAVIHDWLYCCAGYVHLEYPDFTTGAIVDAEWVQLTRGGCDAVFRQALLATGGDKYTYHTTPVRYTQRQVALFWAGVRLGGWLYWGKRKDGIDFDYDFANDFILGNNQCELS